MTTNAKTITVPENGEQVFIPLNKLKKHPKNARKTPHSEASIEGKAASIATKGMLQNLVVEPEIADGEPTGFYFVSIGEGRRLAQLLRVKRKEIRKTEPIRCVIDTANDAAEISLDENVNREDLHPADEFERFRELSEDRGWEAEEVAARFGTSAHVVKQRLRLGAVSPKLVQVYRDGGLTMEQLQAFAITDDHARQEQVYENLSYNKEPWIIRRDLTASNVAASDRRAVFVGPEAYAEAGGHIIRDLFTEDRGGFYEDAALLDRLAIDKLERLAAETQEAEGWKWASAHIDYPHAHGMRRTYPRPVELSEEDAATYDAAQDELERLSAEWEDADVDLPPEVDQRFAELEAEIERIDGLRHAHDADDIARGGAFVVLNHDGTARIERGFIRAEDEAPEPEEGEGADGETVIDGVRVNGDGEVLDDGDHDEHGNHISALEAEEAEEDGKPLSDSLIRDLTAHRTLALRLALGEQPDMALIAVTHTLAAQTFYRGAEANCLEIRPTSSYLASDADGIEDTAAAKALADRHAGWAADMPRDVSELWGFVAGLDHASVMALLAHCAAQTVNAVKMPLERKPLVHQTADRLATAVALDMTAHWTPTVRAYLSFYRAAQALGTSQSSVSARIKALEEELGIRLFERNTRGVRLTEAGRLFVERVSAGVDQLDHAVKTAGMAASGECGRLRIGIHAMIPRSFLAELIGQYREDHPGIEVEIAESTARHAVMQLRADRLDVAFVAGRPALPDCHSRCIWTEPLLAALPEGHPLAGRPAVTWADLAGETFLVRHGGTGPQVHDHIVLRLAGSWPAPSILRFEVGRGTLFSMIGKGFGITIVGAATSLLPTSGLVFPPVADEPEPIPFSAVWSPSTQSAALQSLLALANKMTNHHRAGNIEHACRQ